MDFLPDMSYTTNRLCQMDRRTQALDSGMVSHATFIGLAKALDGIPKILLPYKTSPRVVLLGKYWFSYKSLYHCQTGYFTLRSFFITWWSAGRITVWSLRFLIYVNDLPCDIPRNIVLNADDVAIWGNGHALVQSAMDHAHLCPICWVVRTGTANILIRNVRVKQFWTVENY